MEKQLAKRTHNNSDKCSSKGMWQSQLAVDGASASLPGRLLLNAMKWVRNAHTTNITPDDLHSYCINFTSLYKAERSTVVVKDH